MSDQRIVFFIFCGRRENMQIQRPFLDRLLTDYPRAELHLWDLARQDSDHEYVQSLHDPANRVHVFGDLWPGHNTWPVGCRKKLKRPKWCGCRDCRPAPYSEVYQWYVNQGDGYADTVFVKLDDDILFIETDRFGEVLATLDERPGSVVSANVANNVVCAKHDPRLRPLVEARFNPATQRDWFDLHVQPDFARISHDWFLNEADHLRTHPTAGAVRTLPGERLSINTIAFTHPTLLRLNAVIQHPRFKKMGDEGAVTHNFLPRIVTGFHVAHLNFGPQRVAIPEPEWATYRALYTELRDTYLHPANRNETP